MVDVDEMWVIGEMRPILLRREDGKDVTHLCTCPTSGIRQSDIGGHRCFMQDVVAINPDCPIHGD